MKLPSVAKLIRRKTPHYCVADLGSSRIKVAICKEADGLKERIILGEGVQLLPRGAMCGGKIIDLDTVTNTLNLALEEAYIKAGVNANRVVIGLSGGVVVPKSYRVRIRRQQIDQKITEKEFEVLAKQVEEKTLEKAEADLKARNDDEYIRIETVFVGYHLDGAKVTTPLDLAGGELEISVLHYFMGASKVRTVNSLVDQLDLEVVSMVDTAVYSAIRWSEQFGDFILVDIGGGTTQVVIIERNKVVESETVFIGGSDVTEEIGERLKIPFDAAENIKLSYVQGHLDQERGRIVHQAITDVGELIVEGVATIIQRSASSILPAQFVIGGESRHLTELKSSLASFPWMREQKFSTFPKIDLVPGKELSFEELTKIEL